MPRLALALFVLLPLGACARPAPPPRLPVGDEVVRIDPELGVRRVAADAYVVTHEPFHASNVLVVRMPDGTVVVSSSPFDTEGTRAMVRWVRASLDPPRILAINTHFHLDGTAGNTAYAEAGVETYASDLTQELVATRGVSHRDGVAASFTDEAQRARISGIEIALARHTFPASDGLELTIAGEVVRVVFPGPAHSPDNVVVHFPARGLLFGGCMIKTGDSIGYIGDADLDHWEEAVRVLEPLAPAVVVPGHGPVGGAELLGHTIDVVRAARASE